MTERTKAILLFTSYFAKEADRVYKPLSLTEWNKLVRWLKAKDLNPEHFLTGAPATLLTGWNDQSISKNRLLGLLERKTALALSLDKWTRAGVWIIGRGEPGYPVKVREKLKDLAPNIFFGVGDKELLHQVYAGVVGSRDTDENDLNTASTLGARLSQQGFGVVSGGAKGVDEAAMLGALENGGACVGILADTLIKKSTSMAYRNYILNGKLVLITPYNPEAGFNAGNAMGRNKLIYALSNLAIVVKSDTKGGTWEGAKENIKNRWTPLFVVESTEKGNVEIVKLGGNWIAKNEFSNIQGVMAARSSDRGEKTLFNSMPPTAPASTGKEPSEEIASEVPATEISVINFELKSIDLFQLFLIRWSESVGYFPISSADLSKRLELQLKQVDSWLKKAAKDKYIIEDNNHNWRLVRSFSGC